MSLPGRRAHFFQRYTRKSVVVRVVSASDWLAVAPRNTSIRGSF